MSQSPLIYLVSPAKTLDFDNAALSDIFSQPVFLDEAENLIHRLRELDSQDLQALMSVSQNIADLNVARNEAWRRPFNLQNAKQAIYAFKGDVYTGINVETAGDQEISYLQDHLRILSGLYGVLKPLDLMQAYRLEMGTKLDNSQGKNLYEFWGDTIANHINAECTDGAVLVNLASNEYFKAAKKKLLTARIITPHFKDLKNGQYKMISFYAKKARGLMVRYAADNQVVDVDALKGFDYEGYTFNDALSKADDWVFTRDQAPA